jgi:hypothetical protein
MAASHLVRLSPVEASAGKDPDIRPKISTIGSASTGSAAIESQWKRATSKDGTGATHVRTFTGKMNASGLEHLDRHINEWLDNHPDAEVTFSTITTGEMGTSIGKESVIVVQVWI